MNLLADGSHRTSVSIISKHDGVAEVRLFISLFGVDSYKIQMFPYLFEESVKVEFHVAADHNCVRLFSNKIDFLHGNSVDLVVAIQTFDVLAVTYVILRVPSTTSIKSSTVLSS